MTTSALPTDSPFPAAAALVRDRLLVRGTSICRSRDRCWRAPALAALHARGDADVDIAAVRRRLEVEHGPGFSFADPALAACGAERPHRVPPRGRQGTSPRLRHTPFP